MGGLGPSVMLEGAGKEVLGVGFGRMEPFSPVQWGSRVIMAG